MDQRKRRQIQSHDVSCGSKEPPEWCPARHCLLSGKECSVEHEFNGRHMLSSAQPLYDRNGKLRYILTSDIDLTDIIRQKEELRRAMEAAQAADRAKSMFLATMSHEIRTPLNAVLGFSDLLLDARLSAKEQTEYLQAIHLAGNSLLNLINDILDLSKLEAEQTEIIPAPTNLPELLHEVAAIFREKIREKHLDYRQEIPPRLPILELDRLRLRQILLNLLGNAVKFTENGSVSLTVTFEPQDHSRADSVSAWRIRESESGKTPARQSSSRLSSRMHFVTLMCITEPGSGWQFHIVWCREWAA